MDIVKVLATLKSNTFQSILFTVAGAGLGIWSAFAQGTPNNPASWLAFGLIAYQIVLNSFQFLARTAYKGTTAGAKLLDVATIMTEIRSIALAVLSHQTELKANVAEVSGKVEEVKTIVVDTAATVTTLPEVVIAAAEATNTGAEAKPSV